MLNNFVNEDPNGSMNMMSTPEDSPTQSPTGGGKRSLVPKHNPMGGKFEPVANSDPFVVNRISDLHS